MEYRLLGNSGLKVSILSYGSWYNTHDPNSLENTKKIVKKCFDSGINYFDTAESYGKGEAEIQLGESLKMLDVSREEIVVSTKLFLGTVYEGSTSDAKCKVNRNGTFRKRVIEGLNASLKRLQLDYVDLVFAHRFDHETPLEEICRSFNYVLQKGLAFYWGTLEWSSNEIKKAMEICEKLGLEKPITEQPQYNMLVREKVENEYVPLFDEFKLGTTVWSPLAGGVLTGKYNYEIPKEGRLANKDPHIRRIYERVFFGEKIYERRLKEMKELEALAKEVGCNMTQLALGWVIFNKDVSSAIFGASSIDQVEDNLKAIEVYKRLNSEILEKIESILQNRPVRGFDYKKYQALPNRR